MNEKASFLLSTILAFVTTSVILNTILTIGNDNKGGDHDQQTEDGSNLIPNEKTVIGPHSYPWEGNITPATSHSAAMVEERKNW